MVAKKNRAQSVNSDYFESFWVMLSMMMVAGYMNAYTYIVRGGIFANNQTANMAKIGIALVNGQYQEAKEVILLVLAALVAACFAEVLRQRVLQPEHRWKQSILLIQTVFFIAVSFVPSTVPHLYVNIPFSFIAIMQLSAFRLLNGRPCNTTICTGNLRTAGALIANAIIDKQKESRHISGQYVIVVFSFVVGAGFGAYFAHMLKEYSILLPCIPVAFVLYFSFKKHGTLE